MFINKKIITTASKSVSREIDWIPSDWYALLGTGKDDKFNLMPKTSFRTYQVIDLEKESTACFFWPGGVEASRTDHDQGEKASHVFKAKGIKQNVKINNVSFLDGAPGSDDKEAILNWIRGHGNSNPLTRSEIQGFSHIPGTNYCCRYIAFSKSSKDATKLEVSLFLEKVPKELSAILSQLDAKKLDSMAEVESLFKKVAEYKNKTRNRQVIFEFIVACYKAVELKKIDEQSMVSFLQSKTKVLKDGKGSALKFLEREGDPARSRQFIEFLWQANLLNAPTMLDAITMEIVTENNGSRPPIISKARDDADEHPIIAEITSLLAEGASSTDSDASFPYSNSGSDLHRMMTLLTALVTGNTDDPKLKGVCDGVKSPGEHFFVTLSKMIALAIEGTNSYKPNIISFMDDIVGSYTKTDTGFVFGSEARIAVLINMPQAFLLNRTNKGAYKDYINRLVDFYYNKIIMNPKLNKDPELMAAAMTAVASLVENINLDESVPADLNTKLISAAVAVLQGPLDAVVSHNSYELVSKTATYISSEKGELDHGKSKIINRKIRSVVTACGFTLAAYGIYSTFGYTFAVAHHALASTLSVMNYSPEQVYSLLDKIPELPKIWQDGFLGKWAMGAYLYGIASRHFVSEFLAGSSKIKSHYQNVHAKLPTLWRRSAGDVFKSTINIFKNTKELFSTKNRIFGTLSAYLTIVASSYCVFGLSLTTSLVAGVVAPPVALIAYMAMKASILRGPSLIYKEGYSNTSVGLGVYSKVNSILYKLEKYFFPSSFLKKSNIDKYIVSDQVSLSNTVLDPKKPDLMAVPLDKGADLLQQKKELGVHLVTTFIRTFFPDKKFKSTVSGIELVGSDPYKEMKVPVITVGPFGNQKRMVMPLSLVGDDSASSLLAKELSSGANITIKSTNLVLDGFSDINQDDRSILKQPEHLLLARLVALLFGLSDEEIIDSLLLEGDARGGYDVVLGDVGKLASGVNTSFTIFKDESVQLNAKRIMLLMIGVLAEKNKMSTQLNAMISKLADITENDVADWLDAALDSSDLGLDYDVALLRAEVYVRILTNLLIINSFKKKGIILKEKTNLEKIVSKWTSPSDTGDLHADIQKMIDKYRVLAAFIKEQEDKRAEAEANAIAEAKADADAKAKAQAIADAKAKADAEALKIAAEKADAEAAAAAAAQAALAAQERTTALQNQALIDVQKALDAANRALAANRANDETLTAQQQKQARINEVIRDYLYWSDPNLNVAENTTVLDLITASKDFANGYAAGNLDNPFVQSLLAQRVALQEQGAALQTLFTNHGEGRVKVAANMIYHEYLERLKALCLKNCSDVLGRETFIYKRMAIEGTISLGMEVGHILLGASFIKHLANIYHYNPSSLRPPQVTVSGHTENLKNIMREYLSSLGIDADVDVIDNLIRGQESSSTYEDVCCSLGLQLTSHLEEFAKQNELEDKLSAQIKQNAAIDKTITDYLAYQDGTYDGSSEGKEEILERGLEQHREYAVILQGLFDQHGQDEVLGMARQMRDARVADLKNIGLGANTHFSIDSITSDLLFMVQQQANKENFYGSNLPNAF